MFAKPTAQAVWWGKPRLRLLRGDRGAKRIPPMCFLAAPYRRRPPHEVQPTTVARRHRTPATHRTHRDLRNPITATAAAIHLVAPRPHRTWDLLRRASTPRV